MSVFQAPSAKCDFPGCEAGFFPDSKMTTMELRFRMAQAGWEFLPVDRGTRVQTESGFHGRGLAGSSWKHVGRKNAADLCPEHASSAGELDRTVAA